MDLVHSSSGFSPFSLNLKEKGRRDYHFSGNFYGQISPQNISNVSWV